MIVLNVTYHCRPELREEFIEMIFTEGIDVSSRAEEGNIKYDYYLPIGECDDLLLVEKWRDADTLANHGKQPHFERLKALKSKYVLDTDIDRFDLPD